MKCQAKDRAHTVHGAAQLGQSYLPARISYRMSHVAGVVGSVTLTEEGLWPLITHSNPGTQSYLVTF